MSPMTHRRWHTFFTMFSFYFRYFGTLASYIPKNEHLMRIYIRYISVQVSRSTWEWIPQIVKPPPWWIRRWIRVNARERGRNVLIKLQAKAALHYFYLDCNEWISHFKKMTYIFRETTKTMFITFLHVKSYSEIYFEAHIWVCFWISVFSKI